MIEYIVKKRKITLLFFTLIVIVGVLSFFQLPKQEMPDVIIRQAIVTTTYPGATPQKVEQTVTKKIEQKIKELQGIKEISSTSGNGISTIVVVADDNVDPKEKWDELRKKVQDAEAELPEGANQPNVNDNLTKAFIQSSVVYADSREDLYKLSDLMKSWKDQLRTVPRVADVTIKGIPEQEVRVDIDMQKMQQYHISWLQLMQAIQAENERVPIGDLDYNERKYQLVIKEAQNVEELNKIIISRTEEGFPIYLEDVGTATLTHAKPDYLAYYNGKPAITISVSAETGSDVPSVHKNVNKMLNKLEKSLPKEVHLKTIYAQKDRVDEMFHDLSVETLTAIAAVILVCTLGLNLITASAVALAIPISMAAGLLLLPSLGITLNQITVVGLIIVLGLLVDDAVVVNDNIERRLTSLGESPSVAAINGTKEVAISIITATLATIAAFAPLIFLKGNMGLFIKPIPTVITFSMLASMVMSLTIIPIFREWHETKRRRDQRKDKPAGLLGKQLHALTHIYSRKIIPKVLQRPLFVGVLGLLIGTLAYGLIPFTPVQLFPGDDKPQFTIKVEMPVGTSLQETDRQVREIANWVQKQPGVKKVTAAAGGAAPQAFSSMGNLSGDGPEVGQLSVVGEEGKMDIEKTPEEWAKKFKELYPGITVAPDLPQAGPPVGKPVSIRITGDDLEKLRSLSEQVKELVADVKGTYDIQDNLGIEQYALEFQVNKQAMDQNLVNYTDLSRTLRLISEGVTVSQFDTGKDLIDIKLYLKNENEDPAVLFQQLSVTNAKGEQIPLTQLAQIKPSFSLKQITHYNLVRTVTVEANVRGRTATEVMTEIKEKLNKMNFPDGYTWETGGETSDQAEVFADLGRLSIVVIFLILILITMQFYSLSIPLIIMTTVYLAASGALIGLFITRTPLGFMTVMGIISLAGIVVRNGIVLIEFIEEARREGMELKEAVIKATEARFRPILLTSLTAIVGLLPIAIRGDVLFKPMAMTIISGLVFSTILTLFVVPSLYTVLATYKNKRQQKKMERQLNQENGLSI
ncbi:multidrug efflux pump subunit AcrB [Anoxybacillus vitaminiphilus]|uniref:Multidrug efflux pump subunit AcrB n=1 Tax=Paranoxybacillus vitaminiphilus TaxID=581036 RepID=A0A327Y9P9_9BACL|nr:efflux RND transporter permease subunit [Anoxybacillus vitaminiphilus]RAK17161.1 multidrug efflux pump subunit AcrB [Anoxybacillus vitaminiphilus]